LSNCRFTGKRLKCSDVNVHYLNDRLRHVLTDSSAIRLVVWLNNATRCYTNATRCHNRSRQPKRLLWTCRLLQQFPAIWQSQISAAQVSTRDWWVEGGRKYPL